MLCRQSPRRPQKIPVDTGFTDGELTWGGAEFKGYEFKWKVLVDEGQIAICGAGFFPDPSSARASRELMRLAYLTLDDRKIMTDISFFTKVRRAADLRSAQATCRSSGHAAPQGEFTVYLEWPVVRKKF